MGEPGLWLDSACSGRSEIKISEIIFDQLRQQFRIAVHQLLETPDWISIMSDSIKTPRFLCFPTGVHPGKSSYSPWACRGSALFLLAWAAVLNLAVLEARPTTIISFDWWKLRHRKTMNRRRCEKFLPPRVAQVETPPVEVLRVPPPEVRPKTAPEEVPVAPKVEIAASQARVPSVQPRR